MPQIRKNRALRFAAHFFPNSHQFFNSKPPFLEWTCRSLLFCPCLGPSLRARYRPALDIQQRSRPRNPMIYSLWILACFGFPYRGFEPHVMNERYLFHGTKKSTFLLWNRTLLCYHEDQTSAGWQSTPSEQQLRRERHLTTALFTACNHLRNYSPTYRLIDWLA